jgi:hypothetical protein
MCVIPALQDVTFHNHTKLLVKDGFISDLIICNCVEVGIVLMLPTKKGKTVQQHTMEALGGGGREGIAPTLSRPRH